MKMVTVALAAAVSIASSAQPAPRKVIGVTSGPEIVLTPDPAFVLIVEDPILTRSMTARHGMRQSEAGLFDLLRVENSDPKAVRRWEKLFTPMPDKKPHHFPFKPWIFGFFGGQENPRIFASNGCIVYSEQDGKSGLINPKLLEWISAEVDIGEFRSHCVEIDDGGNPIRNLGAEP
jgi:hypothetical protein